MEKSIAVQTQVSKLFRSPNLLWEPLHSSFTLTLELPELGSNFAPVQGVHLVCLESTRP
jgi:hypothetical protein